MTMLNTSDNVERLAQERRVILCWFTAIYAVWYGALIVGESGWLPRPAAIGSDVVAAVGGLVWSGTAIWLGRWSRRARASGQTLAALEDELAVRNRWRAQRASMFVMLGCLVIGLAVTTFVQVKAQLVLQLLIWVLVVSQLGLYLWFDRSE